MFLLEIFDFLCCCVDWASGLCDDQFVCLCSSWAWGGRVGGLWLRIWLRRCQGWRWWERIWVRKRELLVWRICIKTPRRKLILNCFLRWVLFCHFDLLIIFWGWWILWLLFEFCICTMHRLFPFHFLSWSTFCFHCFQS